MHPRLPRQMCRHEKNDYPAGGSSAISRKAMRMPKMTLTTATPASNRATTTGNAYARRMNEIAEDKTLRTINNQNCGLRG